MEARHLKGDRGRPNALAIPLHVPQSTHVHLYLFRLRSFNPERDAVVRMNLGVCGAEHIGGGRLTFGGGLGFISRLGLAQAFNQVYRNQVTHVVSFDLWSSMG